MRIFAGNSEHPEALRRALKTVSALDAILEPDPGLRYHSYCPKRFPHTDVGVVNNGAGDEMFCFFSDEQGSLIKGFDHTSPLSPHAFATGPDDFRPWPGIYEQTPKELLEYLEPPDFNKVEVTFCLWRRIGDQHWWQGDVDAPEGADDGAAFLLGTIFLDAGSYVDWACNYYGRDVPRPAVEEIYAARNVSRSAALALNPHVDLGTLRAQLAASGSMLV